LFLSSLLFSSLSLSLSLSPLFSLSNTVFCLIKSNSGIIAIDSPTSEFDSFEYVEPHEGRLEVHMKSVGGGRHDIEYYQIKLSGNWKNEPMLPKTEQLLLEEQKRRKQQHQRAAVEEL
jgi:hypothetical protein